MRALPNATRLLALDAKAALHRLRHDLGRELTVLACGAVLLALFGYVFHDFLNVQVASLSGTMRKKFADAAAACLAGLMLVIGVALLRRGRWMQGNIGSLAARLGEDRRTVQGYQGMRTLLILAVLHGSAWYIVFRWLTPQSSRVVAVAETLLIGATLAFAARAPSVQDEAAKTEERTTSDASKAPRPAAWRMKSLLRRRASIGALVMAGAFSLAAGVAAAAKMPAFVSAAAALAAGLFTAAGLAFQAADDLAEAWVERQLGLSHDDFIAAYEILGVKLGALTGISAMALSLLGLILAGTALDAQSLLQIFSIGMLPALSLPWLMLQIDARRPLVVMLTLVLVDLFVGTAILAHPLLLALIPLLRYYGARTQAGRYYRA